MIKKISMYHIVSLLVIIVSYIVNYSTHVRTIKKLSEFAFWMSVPAFVFSLVIFFLSEKVSKSWQKFTLYFMLASLGIILITPNSSHGMDIYPLIKENATIVLSTLYSIISLLLILYKSSKKS
jgi:hypothetical protein